MIVRFFVRSTRQQRERERRWQGNFTEIRYYTALGKRVRSSARPYVAMVRFYYAPGERVPRRGQQLVRLVYCPSHVMDGDSPLAGRDEEARHKDGGQPTSRTHAHCFVFQRETSSKRALVIGEQRALFSRWTAALNESDSHDGHHPMLD